MKLNKQAVIIAVLAALLGGATLIPVEAITPFLTVAVCVLDGGDSCAKLTK